MGSMPAQDADGTVKKISENQALVCSRRKHTPKTGDRLPSLWCTPKLRQTGRRLISDTSAAFVSFY
jgi:hypothetical protein